MPVDNMAVAVYSTRQAAEDAVAALQKAGFDSGNVSIAARDHDAGTPLLVRCHGGGRVIGKAEYGASWGAMWRTLPDAACFDMPGIGPVLVAGPWAGWIREALSGETMVDGLSPAGAGLYSVGLPEASVLAYEAALQTHKLVLLAHGEPDRVEQARIALERTSAVALSVHDTFNPGPVAQGLDGVRLL